MRKQITTRPTIYLLMRILIISCLFHCFTFAKMAVVRILSPMKRYAGKKMEFFFVAVACESSVFDLLNGHRTHSAHILRSAHTLPTVQFITLAIYFCIFRLYLPLIRCAEQQPRTPINNNNNNKHQFYCSSSY